MAQKHSAISLPLAQEQPQKQQMTAAPKKKKKHPLQHLIAEVRLDLWSRRAVIH